MIQMSEETQDGNVIYRDVVFKNKNNKKPNEKKSEETTYAEIKTQDGNVIYHDVVFKNKNNKKPMQVESEETTYAEIKKASKDSGVVYTEVKPNAKSKAKDLPQNTEPETLYACVNKKKPATAKHNWKTKMMYAIPGIGDVLNLFFSHLPQQYRFSWAECWLWRIKTVNMSFIL